MSNRRKVLKERRVQKKEPAQSKWIEQVLIELIVGIILILFEHFLK